MGLNNFVEKTNEEMIEGCIDDTEDYIEETVVVEAIEEESEAKLPPVGPDFKVQGKKVPVGPLKGKKPRSQKQIDSLAKAREARKKNIALRKQGTPIEPPTRPKTKLSPATPPSIAAPIVPILKAQGIKKAKKKSRRKIIIQQDESTSDDTSSEEELIVIKPKRRRPKGPKPKPQPVVESSSEDDVEYYEVPPKNYYQPAFRFI